MSMAVDLAVKGAQEALGESFGVEGAEEDKVPESTFRGRRYTHWSEYAAAGGAVVGVVAAIAGFVFSSPPIILLGLVMSVTNTVTFFYLRKFVPMQSLAGYVKLLGRRVTLFGEHISGLRKVNQELDSYSKDFKAHIENAKRIAADAEKRLQAKVKELNKVSEELKSTSNKFSKLQKLYDVVKDVAGQVNKDLESFNNENAKFHDNVKRLEEEKEKLVDVRQSIEAAAQAQSEQLGTMDNQNRELVVVMGQLQLQVQTLQALYKLIKEEREKLKEAADGLAVTQANTTKEAEHLKDATENLTQVNSRMDALINLLKDSHHDDELESPSPLTDSELVTQS